MKLWHASTEAPPEEGPCSGLIALPAEEGDDEPFVLGLAVWRKSQWIMEDSGKPIPYKRYFWCLESELLRDVSNDISECKAAQSRGKYDV